ncbi:MAG: nuclear transport factor 2 family protein [Anaerolineae bacterium]|nr:MAG: nuclear transport factor 2 family protein [Anaerolineae bacterium]
MTRQPRRTKMSRIEGGVRLLLDYKDALDRRDVDGLLALLTDDCRFESHTPAPDGATFSGKQAIGDYWREFFAACTDFRAEGEDVFAIGFHCVMRWTRTWTEVDGRERRLRGVDVFKIREGLIEEVLEYGKG